VETSIPLNNRYPLHDNAYKNDDSPGMTVDQHTLLAGSRSCKVQTLLHRKYTIVNWNRGKQRFNELHNKLSKCRTVNLYIIAMDREDHTRERVAELVRCGGSSAELRFALDANELRPKNPVAYMMPAKPSNQSEPYD